MDLGKVEMSIKKKIKSNLFLRYYIEKRKWKKYLKLSNKFTDYEYIQKLYREANNGIEANLVTPVLFTEKLQWLKLFYRDERIPICSNKVTAKDYVSKQGLSYLLVPTLGIYTSPDEINQDDLPDQFIIKGSHGSGWNIIVHDKSKANWYNIRRVCRSWLNQNIYVYGREWNYRDQPRHIIIEPLLSDEAPIDYKVMCFNGKARAFQINHNENGVHYVDLYDADWNLFDDTCIGINEHCRNPLPKPPQFDKLKQIAEKLSAPFPFVRVDFYNFDDKVYFGEMTFFPGSGFWHITPEERNKQLGDWLILPTKNENIISDY